MSAFTSTAITRHHIEGLLEYVTARLRQAASSNEPADVATAESCRRALAEPFPDEPGYAAVTADALHHRGMCARACQAILSGEDIYEGNALGAAINRALLDRAATLRIGEQRHQVTIQIDTTKLARALRASFKDGALYWARRVEVVQEPIVPAAYPYQVPLLGGVLRIGLHNPKDIKRPPSLLNLTSLLYAVGTLAERYPHHLAALVQGSDEVEPGDALVQCAIFGEMVYG